MRNPIWPMWPCVCCDAAATHRDEAGNARCEEHRLSEDIDRMDAERLRQLVRNLKADLQIAATRSDRESSLQTKLDALREEHRRLRAAHYKLLDKNPYPNEECKNCLCNMRSGCELAQEWNRKKAGT